MRFVGVILLLVAWVTIGVRPSYAFEERGFLLTPPTLNTLTYPGGVEKVTHEIVAPEIEHAVYPIGITWQATAPKRFSYAPSQWLKFSRRSFTPNPGTDALATVTLKTTTDTTIGEHYQIAAYGTQSRIGEESDNPTILVGTPIITQVARVDYDRATNPQSDLKSMVSLVQARTYFNPTAGTQQFSITVKNEGNISSIPFGVLVIKNSKGETVESLPFNTEERHMLPNSETTFSLAFTTNKVIYGILNAEILLGHKNSGEEVPQRLVKRISFLFVSYVVFRILVLLVLMGMVIYILSKVKALRKVRYIGYGVLAISFIASILQLLNTPPTRPDVLGNRAVNDWKSAQVTAAIKETIGVKIERKGNVFEAVLIGNTPKGWAMYSLRGERSKLIGQGSHNPFAQSRVSLSGDNARFPILVIPRIFLTQN